MRTLRLAIVVVLSCGLFAVGLGAPVKVILDTDMYDDFDDIGALALLHALADEGKCEILATVSSTRETPSVGVCQLVNASYGRPDIPVGAPALGKHGKPFLAYPFYEDLVRRHPEVFPTSDLAPDAVSVYRRALASSPDGSVTICSVGFLTNLRRLLESSADASSPLDGKALIARKVKAWYAMACRYPEGRECNSSGDAAASRVCLRDWPTPVYFADWWLGAPIFCGKSVPQAEGASEPVREIYRRALEKNHETEKGHAAWDQVTVLAAVLGWESHFGVERGQFRIVTEEGRNAWTADDTGSHARLFAKTPAVRLAQIIDDYMTRPPSLKRKCSAK